MSLSLSQSKLSLKDSITELDFNICAPIFLKVIESDSNSVIKSVTLSSVYFPKTSNANAQTYMKQLWDIETELFERYYPIPYSLSVEKLVELLSKHEKDIFDYKPESYNIFGVDHVKYVAKISRDLLTLVSDSKSTAKHSLKLIKAEQVRDDQLLPNLRLLFESQRVDGYSLFLRQEAMNARLIVKKSGSSQRLKNITEFIYNSINYCRPTLYDISSILNLQVFLDNLSGFNFSEPRKLALYSKNDKAPGFIGIKLVGGTMNDKFQLSIQENKSQTLPLVKFKQAVESGNGVNCKIKLSTGESVGTCLIESDPDFKPHQNDVNLEESPQDGITTRDYIMTHNWPQSDLKLKGIKKGEYKSLVYVCSSSDCENERDVISELSRELDYKTFFVQYLECSDKEKQLDNLRVSLSLMERSDVALFLMGTRLGRLYEPEEIKLIIPPNRISLLKYQNAMFDIEIQITYARQILKRENIVFFYRHKDFNLTVPKMLRHRFLAETMHEEQVSQTIIDYIDEKVVYSVVFSHVADNKVIMGKLSTLREQLHTSCNSAIKSSLISRVESESVKFRDFDLLPYQADFIQNILEKIETYSTGTCIILKGEAGSGKSTLVDLVCAHLNYENWLVLNEKIDAKKLIPLLRSYASALAFSSHEEAIPHRAFELETCFKNIIRSRLATSCKIVLVIQNYTNFNTSLLSKLINGCEGKGGKIIWLLTSNEDSHLKIDSSELKIHTVPLIDRTDLMHVAKSLIGSGSIEIAEKISSEYLFKCTTLFHLNLVLSNIKLKRESGLFVKISRIPDSSIGLIEEILNRFEQSENSKYIQQCLTLLCVSRSGLNELEICGILSLSNILWDYVFKTLIPYFKVSRNGQIELYHDIFRTIVRNRYLKNNIIEVEYNIKMANYFLVENQTQLMYTRRFLDGVYCLLQTPCKSSQLETTVTSIQFIQSAITSGRYFEITEMLAKASAIATSENNSRVYAKIKEYSCFWLKNSLNLLQYPSCLFTLALNLPPGFCNSLRSDAANFQSSTIRMLNVSKPNDVCSFVKIGRHPVAIVSLSVQITRSLGKCCFSASTDGTIKAWDIMSYLPIGILLDAPFEEVQVEQVFYLNNCQHVVFGCNDQFIYVYDLRTKILIQKTSYDLGKFFSTTGRHGIWTCHESNLKFIPIDDHKNITNHESGQSLNGYCNEILFTSFDHSKAAVYSEKLGGILILSTENAHVLCRFKDELISSKSIGQFSSTRNHVGATRSDQSIMVWKIDSHSRVSLLAPPHVDLGHIKSLTFSSDEKLICAGCFNYRQGNIIVGNISTGKWIKLLCANVESPMHNLGLVTFPNSSERIIGTYKDQIFVSNSAKITARNPDLAKVRRLDHLSESISEIALVGDLFYTLSRHESYIISWANEKSIIEFPSRINSFLIDEYIFLATDVSIIVSREVEIIITIEQEYPVKTIKTYRHSPSSYSIVVILQENTLKWYTINTNSFEFKLKYVLKDIQLIPLNPFTSTGNAIYVCHDDTIELISIENKILKTFKTWGSESIVYLYSSRDQIVYCTRNIVYLEDVIVSACGSLPDNYYIHSVKSHNGSVGYHATDKLDSLERVVVIKDNKRDGVYNQKCCILEWYFVDVGIVTIATDDMIRVFKGNQVAIYCFDARITTLVYNDSVFFVGDVDGNVQKIKLITG